MPATTAAPFGSRLETTIRPFTSVGEGIGVGVGDGVGVGVGVGLAVALWNGVLQAASATAAATRSALKEEGLGNATIFVDGQGRPGPRPAGQEDPRQDHDHPHQDGEGDGLVQQRGTPEHGGHRQQEGDGSRSRRAQRVQHVVVEKIGDAGAAGTERDNREGGCQMQVVAPTVGTATSNASSTVKASCQKATCNGLTPGKRRRWTSAATA